MRIALLTLGTRGDVQPYAVLGQALRERGHQVVLSTGKNFGRLAKDYGLEFEPVEADFQALINSEEGKAMMKNPFLARKHFARVIEPMMIESMKKFFDVAKTSDRVLYHVKALGDFFADQFPEKMIRANVIPAIQPTAEFPNPVFSGFSLPRFLNRFTYKLADLGMTMMKKAIREFRTSSSMDPNFKKDLNLPAIYGISPSFLPKPLDYKSETYFTGFWHGESPDELEKDVVDFISSGKKTVVVTFGSMPFEAKFNLKTSLNILADVLGVNVLVVKGWGFENVSVSETGSLKIIQGAPFNKLFSKVDAVVHHGGIGTLSECLRVGIPSLSCPVIFPMGDQHFWGTAAYKNGCAPKPVPLKKLNGKLLLNSVSELLNSEQLRTGCRNLASKLSTERGLENAIRFVEAHYSSKARIELGG